MNVCISPHTPLCTCTRCMGWRPSCACCAISEFAHVAHRAHRRAPRAPSIDDPPAQLMPIPEVADQANRDVNQRDDSGKGLKSSGGDLHIACDVINGHAARSTDRMSAPVGTEAVRNRREPAGNDRNRVVSRQNTRRNTQFHAAHVPHLENTWNPYPRHATSAAPTPTSRTASLPGPTHRQQSASP